MRDTHLLLEFQYATYTLEPYAYSEGTSTKLLKDIIIKLNDPDFPSDKRIKDRHENRKDSVKRRLVHISSPFESKGRRCFGKIALIKNKAPMTWSGKDLIEEIENPENKEFIEVTNYVIHFSDTSNPVMMVEHNYSGPRLSDIEFYFRQIARDFKLAKAIKSSSHLNMEYSELDRDLKNIFFVTVKLNSNIVERSGKFDWFKALKYLKDDSGYKDVRMELFYQRKKNTAGEFIRNIQGLDFARGILGWLKKDDNNIESVEDLKMSYQVNGNEEIIDLDFIKNKTTSIINIPLYNKTQYKFLDFKEVVGQEFNYYLLKGKTHIENQKSKSDA